jgi:hypothetical protein
MRDHPKYIATFRTDFDDENITPIQAGVAALREMRSDLACVDVYDVDTKQTWDVRFRDHVLEIIELVKGGP